MAQVKGDTYFIWTMGCQMNKADSDRLSGGLEEMGLSSCDSYAEASCVIINTCVVRQRSYNAAASMINKVADAQQDKADKFLAVMGCMVGPSNHELKRKFPAVDVWARPQQFAPIIETLALKRGSDVDGCLNNLVPITPKVSAFISAVHGCDKFCTFCIIPYRRGRETSRPLEELENEARLIARRGIREITVLGQNIDSYGQDLTPRVDLSDLLGSLNDIDELERVRFLTSHPNDMSRRIVRSIRELPKVCETINLPFQAGSNRVLADMRRGYTREQYFDKIAMIREEIPEVALTTDVIVGFGGETVAEFEETLNVLERVRFAKVHAFRYSVRPQSFASRRMDDQISAAEKKRRLAILNDLQKQIITEDNSKMVGLDFDVLIEEHNDGKAMGRTRSDKIIHTADTDQSLEPGRVVNVKITSSSPWSLQGELTQTRETVMAG